MYRFYSVICKEVCDVSICSVLPKKSVGSVIIGQMFEKYQDVYSKNVYLNRYIGFRKLC